MTAQQILFEPRYVNHLSDNFWFVTHTLWREIDDMSRGRWQKMTQGSENNPKHAMCGKLQETKDIQHEEKKKRT